MDRYSFNLFVNDLFLFSNLSNYKDPNNLLITRTFVKLINQMPLSDFRWVNNWFYENFMIVNPEKSHSMSVSNDTDDKDGFHYDNLPFRNTNKR